MMSIKKNNLSDTVKKIELVFFGLIAAFLIAECLLRIFSGLPVESRFIDRGQADAIKILCLGDSFTYGIGADAEYSYPLQLEKRLRQMTGENIIVVNAGVSAANSSAMLTNLKVFLKRTRPDIVILMAGRNDSWNFKDISGDLSPGLKIKRCLSGIKLLTLFRISKVNLEHFFRKEYKVSEDLGKNIEQSRYYKKQGKIKEALSLLERCLSFDPENKEVFKELDSIFASVPQPDQKIDFYESLLIWKNGNDELRSRLALAYMEKADSCYSSGLYDEVLYYYQKAFDLDPFNSAAYSRVYYNKALEKKYASQERHQSDDVYDLTYSNIREISRMCSEQNIRLLFSGYPEDIYASVKGFGEENNIDFVDQRKSFQAAVASDGRERFFIEDGHCTRWGYELVAGNIADRIIGLIDSGEVEKR